MTTTIIYVELFLAATAYALALAKWRHIWEPHLTWLEVVIGAALCLLAPFIIARYGGAGTGWERYEGMVWAAFLIGGTPIVIWQLAQSIRAWRRIERRIRSRNGHEADQAAAMAVSRRRGQETDD